METGKNSKVRHFFEAVINRNIKLILFLLLGLMFVSVFVNREWPLITVHDVVHRRLLSMKWMLFPHIFCGFTGLVLGPSQFSSRVRKKNLSLHRFLGKMYVTAILFASSLAFLISINYPTPGASTRLTFENLVQSLVWFFTTLIAFITARNGQIDLHKIWMSRSYGVTCIFVISRAVNPLRLIGGMNIESFGVYLWFLIVLALIVPEILLNWQQVFLRKKKLVVENLPNNINIKSKREN